MTSKVVSSLQATCKTSRIEQRGQPARHVQSSMVDENEEREERMENEGHTLV